MALRLYGDGNIENVTSINTAVSSTELGYLDGVSSGIQNQMNSRSVLQTQYVSSSTRVAPTVTSTFAEVSTDYRINITPSSASNYIILTYFVPINPSGGYASNILYTLKPFRIIDGGAKSYALTSAGNTNGSREAMAGQTLRPPGYDANDPMPAHFTAIDAPNTTGVCTYGFDFRRESGSGACYFGYSAGDSAIWGYDTDIVITAQEIAT